MSPIALLAKICKSARARDDRQWQLLFVDFAEVVICQYEFSRQESDDFIPHVLPDRWRFDLFLPLGVQSGKPFVHNGLGSSSPTISTITSDQAFDLATLEVNPIQ